MHRIASFLLVVALAIVVGRTASAQDASAFDVSVVYWRPAVSLRLASDGAGSPGTPIDLGADLNVAGRSFPAFAAGFRPAVRHRLRFEYIPIRYDATTTIERELVFSGATYARGQSVASSFAWNAINIGYEYDFVMRPGSRVGLLVEGKSTVVEQRLTSGSSDRSRRTSVPAPAVGLTVQKQVSRTVGLNAEARGFAVPDSQHGHYGGRYIDIDGGATVGVARHISARAGVRWLNIRHLGESDSARLSLPGAYAGIVVAR